MKEPRFLIRVASVLSSVLLVAGFVTLRAGVFDGDQTMPVVPALSVASEIVAEPVFFDLQLGSLFNDFKVTDDLVVVAPTTQLDTFNRVDAFEIDPAFPQLQINPHWPVTTPRPTLTLMSGSKTAFGVVVVKGSTDIQPIMPKRVTSMAGSKSAVIDWGNDPFSARLFDTSDVWSIIPISSQSDLNDNKLKPVEYDPRNK